MKAEEIMAVISAKQQGKGIQYLTPNGQWIDCDTMSYDFVSNTYRVKPEHKEPEYVPFSNAKECYEAIRQHGAIVVNHGIYFTITRFNDAGVHCSGSLILYGSACKDPHFTFADGTKFGKLVNEQR